MGATLPSKELSVFEARTYQGLSANNPWNWLHIGHTFKVTVLRPDHLLSMARVTTDPEN